MNKTFRITKEQDGNVYIAPMDAATNGKYLIQVSSEKEALSIRPRLSSGELKTPLEDDSLYKFVRDSGVTRIYGLV